MLGQNQLRYVILILVAYSAGYGLVLINWIDLYAGESIPYYHLWLILMYFAPFVTVVVFEGIKDWDYVLALGLFTSLMNDLFYGWIGVYFTGKQLEVNGQPVDLLTHYVGQLGLLGWTPLFTFHAGGASFEVYSWLMGLAIFARIGLVYYLVRRWWGRP
jgi:hypothetical protein